MAYTRKNLIHLSDAEHQKLVEGFTGLLSYPSDDERGFLYWAGLHGYPNQHCEHGNPLFLAWHRPYVLALEKALQDVLGDYEFGLPYWDWSSDDLEDAAIPEILRTAPLNRVRIRWGQSLNRWTRRLNRSLDNPFLSEARRWAGVARARDAFETIPRSSSFQQNCENAHNNLHVWIGGDMSDPNWAAFDPIFWFHHCNVDRQWADWQDDHPDANYSFLNGVPLAPFSTTGDQVIDFRALGYDYATTDDGADVADEISGLQSTEPLRKRMRVPDHFRDAILKLSNVKYPLGSLQVRVFVNDPDANALTPLAENPHLGSTYTVFSHRECVGADEDHCSWKKPRSAQDPRGAHHALPFDIELDLSESIRAVRGTRKTVDISLVLIDADGEAVPTDRLQYDRLSLRTRG